jgi:ATP-binding cassette subfamily B protein
MARSKSRLVPEVVQSSAMDCGPAALKAYVEGHGVSVSYGRLREACQTDVDGTVIEALQAIAVELGVPVEQVLLPKDLVLLEEAGSLPCIAVTRLPNGNTHFAVIWSFAAGVAQVMDPASGRRWMTRSQLLHELYEHAMSVPAEDWREWAGSAQGRSLVANQLSSLGIAKEAVTKLIESAAADPSWRGLASLDAAARAVRSMLDAGACKRGREAAEYLTTLLSNASSIPKGYWSVRDASDGEVEIRGAVLLRPPRDDETPASPMEGVEGVEDREFLSKALQAARDEAPARPALELWQRIREDGLLTPAALVAALFGAAFAIVIEALLFRSLLELAPLFGLSEYRAGIIGALLAFMLFALVVDYATVTGELRVGRRLETRLRVAFQEKIPRLGDRYFHSRLTSDMAERNHSIHLLRTLPVLAGQILRASFEIVLTTAAIVWLVPSTTPIVLLVLATSLLIPLLAQPVFLERDLRVRSHVGGLSSFYLDALLGLVPLRVHGAQAAIRTQHESLLVEWARARLGLQRAAVGLEGAQFLVGYGLVVMLLLSYLNQGGETAAILLLAYWALNLPVLGLEIVRLAWRYPEQRNTTLRITEPLHALEEKDAAPTGDGEAPDVSGPPAIRIENATVRAAGHRILEAIDVSIKAGSHVAVVGPSGSGKSSLFGLLLGWHFPDEGRVMINGSILSGERLDALRQKTAWVDPAVQLWNRSLVDNLRYGNGNDNDAKASLMTIVEQAELRSVLEMLPEGHQTKLGDGGGLVSGGEGQRVRLARAFMRPNVSLALMDEPFRGLGRRQRATLLRRARELWSDATLLCITHDVSETEGFDRVLVMEEGRLVEDGTPAALAEDASSRYRALLDSERELMKVWSEKTWRRFEIVDGRVQEQSDGA